MPFNRVWNDTCPREYDRWEADGATWIVQDLPPEDDEQALNLLVEYLLTDELLSSLSEINNDPISLNSAAECWRVSLKQRMSLACYEIRNGKKTLAAINCCVAHCQGEHAEIKMEGEAWKNVINVVTTYVEEKCDAFKHLGLDVLLGALGLVVPRRYRGKGLGPRVVAARKPLALSQGIKGSVTLFTTPGGQKCGEKCGFTTISTITLRELADAGFKYPRDDRTLKYMVKRYAD